MATNHYFSNYRNKYTEQHLVEDLIVESIKMMGMDCFYLPNDNDVARDFVYGEDPLKTFTSAYSIEIYPSNVTEYGGDREFFSKFGLELRNDITVIMSRRSFNELVANGTNITRPREGDLIYVPPLRGKGELYEIKFVNTTKDMSMFGRKNSFFFEIELEKFKYSQETIATGIDEIDLIQQVEAYSQRLVLTWNTVTGVFNPGELVYLSPDGTYANRTATAYVAGYDINNHYLDLNEINGELQVGQTVTGNISGVSGYIESTDIYYEAQVHADSDNDLIFKESNTIIDFSETNPFGSI
jgi:hypothetical protein